MTKNKKVLYCCQRFLGGFTQDNINSWNPFLAFLKEASLNTYANENSAQAPPLRPGWKHYHYESPNHSEFVYDDEYYGSSPFLGQEIVCKNGKPIWGMNYFGAVTGAEVDEKAVYSFLRSALMIEAAATDSDLHEVGSELILPVRGPKLFAEADWTYRFDAEGDITNFFGDEAIFSGNRIVYRAHIHGGSI